MLGACERLDLGVERRSWRCLRSWKSWAMKRWETLFGTVVCAGHVSLWSQRAKREGRSRTHVGVISKIRAGLVACRGGRRRLPARDIDGVKVLRHLRDHGRVEAAIRVAGITVLTAHSLVSPRSSQPLSCFGRSPTLNRFSRIPHSFLDCVLPGYSIGRFPLF